MVDYIALLDIIKNGYNFDYATATTPAGGASTQLLDCPISNVRYVYNAVAQPTTSGVEGIHAALAIRRNGRDYLVGLGLQKTSAAGGTNQFGVLQTPVCLFPGDTLRVLDLNLSAGKQVIGYCCYVEVPTHAPIFKKGRRG